ncbi:AraC family transcriptional regulator [Mycobacterium sp. 3519A]|uniref:AraC family transcriptional regulator n=1 Tax=Mycobacterium sp. 3519A TaxID=2057184 RepID=UPI000C7BCF93|nr:AraC family transcriptional regulator [Mycobacterium sp. 3519A]
MAGYVLGSGWHVVLRDLGIDTAATLARADLPRELLARPDAMLTIEQFYRLWTAVEAEFDGPDVALAMAQAITTEAFTPAIFAGLCSPTLRVAAERIATYKRLFYPVTLDVKCEDALRIAVKAREPFEPPPVLARFELLFWIRFARLGTREHIRPIRLTFPAPVPDRQALAEFAGGDCVVIGRSPEITFGALDARCPFVTANEAMWQVFEPTLRQRLTVSDDNAPWSARVHAALLAALPAGRGSLSELAADLHLSARSLQRRLAAEGDTFQGILDRARERLARHFLTTTDLPDSEIAFLIGYDEPASFHRRFRSWTGCTPGEVRAAVLEPKSG